MRTLIYEKDGIKAYETTEGGTALANSGRPLLEIESKDGSSFYRDSDPVDAFDGITAEKAKDLIEQLNFLRDCNVSQLLAEAAADAD